MTVIDKTSRATRHGMLLLALLVAITAAARLDARTATVANDRNGSAVVRVYYNDIRELSRLQTYDLWEYNNTAERYVLVALDAIGYESLLREGWRIEIDRAVTASIAAADSGTSFAGGYRSVDELYADLDAANDDHPQLVELVDYGESHCLGLGGCHLPDGELLAGYPLRAVRVTNEAIAGSSQVEGGVVTRGEKPIFFLMANIHAREITTPEIAMRYLDMLLDGYGSDADITWIVDWHEIWIVPTANPDGHWIVEMGARPEYGGSPYYQRKNANFDADANGSVDCPVWPPGFGGPQPGIDLNRNHSFGWGGDGASAAPCDMTYLGLGPASENETVYLEALIRALIPDQRGPELEDAAPDDTTGLFITLHSFSDLVLWPWGHLYVDAPNKDALKAIGDKMAAYNGYLSCQPTACLYAAAGATDDWAYGELGIPAFTFEIGKEFMPRYEVIDSVQWPENRPALLYAAQIARAPYQIVFGPEIADLTLQGDGALFELSATVTDEQAGGRPVAGAVFTVDVPPWQLDARPITLQPIDSWLDEAVVSVRGELDAGDLLPGRHTLYIHGQDDQGNWGPIRAVFFEVTSPALETLYLPSVLAE